MRSATALAALLAASVMPTAIAQTCSARSGDLRTPLVELYTSEGCSSCPPADRWLSARARASDANWLAFHVDYWDDIGWPDRFASPLFSQRQQLRVSQAGARNVYTPQVMVGSRVDASWQSASAFDATLAEARGAPGAALGLRLERTGKSARITLDTQALTDSAADATVWLAQTVDAQTTQVRAGENHGATLHHDRVVQQLAGGWPLGAGSAQRMLDLAAMPSVAWRVVAFVQDARGNTLQSLSLDASRCAESAAPP